MIELPYGVSTQSALIPKDWHLQWLRIAPQNREQSAADIVRRALAHPIASSPLEDFVSPDDTIAVIVSDKTRLCGTHIFLPILLEKLATVSVKPEQITIIFANGTHPSQTEEEKRTILGDLIYNNYKIIEHNSKDETAMVFVGTTKYGTDIKLNHIIPSSTKIIATGTIIHHYFAGFGGGAKLFFPGLSAYSTAVQNHRRTLTDTGDFHPDCADRIVETNPVALDILDAIRFLPPVFYFGTILGMDGTIIEALCGDLREAHSRGCRIADQIYSVEVPKQADITIVSAGGYPKDINFIQAHKSLHRASYITREGGIIILVSECADGIGNETFLRWFRYSQLTEMRESLVHHYSINGHTALSMRMKSDKFRIYTVSSLPRDSVHQMGMIPAFDIQTAINKASATLPSCPLVYILENGSMIVPKVFK